jgi:hypothetical protein
MRSCEVPGRQMMQRPELTPDQTGVKFDAGAWGLCLHAGEGQGICATFAGDVGLCMLDFCYAHGGVRATKLEFDGSVVQNHVHTHTHPHTPTHTYAQMHTHFSKLDSGEPSCADAHAHARTHRVDMHMLIHTEAHAHARTNRVHMHVLMRTRRSTHR